LPNGGFLADTPGFSTLDVERYEKIRKENLAFCFPEFAEYIGNCKFTSCTHCKEKGCAIIQAVEDGKIAKSRHASYIAMYDEAKEIKDWEWE
jgi:ribosome biogenesis GTPase